MLVCGDLNAQCIIYKHSALHYVCNLHILSFIRFMFAGPLEATSSSMPNSCKKYTVGINSHLKV